MKLAYLSTRPVGTAGARSRTARPHYITRALRAQGFALEYVAVALEPAPWFKFVLAVKRRWYEGLLHKQYLWERDPHVLRRHAARSRARLANLQFDAVFAHETLPLAYLACDKPIFFWHDATFAGLLHYYPGMSDPCAESICRAHAAERASLRRCAAAIYSSDWAARSARDHYGIEPGKIHVVPFGPYTDCDRTRSEIERVVASRSFETCRLLFVGHEWARKGGEIAVAAAETLNQNGVPTVLTIIGAQCPEKHRARPFVNWLGVLDKSDPNGKTRMREIMESSHFLVLPTQADCVPTILLECYTCGLPVLTTTEGGIPSVVDDGRTGKLFPADSRPAAYSAWIAERFAEPDRYRRMALAAFETYETRLNWSVSGARVKVVIEDAVRYGCSGATQVCFSAAR